MADANRFGIPLTFDVRSPATLKRDLDRLSNGLREYLQSLVVETPPGVATGTYRELAPGPLQDGPPEPGSLPNVATASLTVDPLRVSLSVRTFDPSAAWGAQKVISVPSCVSGDLHLRTISRAATAPTGHVRVARQLHVREVTSAPSFVPTLWTSYTLPAITMPSGSIAYQHTRDRVSLTELGITEGRRYQVVLTRNASNAVDDCLSHWLVESVTLEVRR